MARAFLEEISLWYKYKTAIWPSASVAEAPSEPAVVIHNIMRVMRAFRNMKRLAYASAPITSGRSLCEFRRQHAGMEEKEILRQVIASNYQRGWEFVEVLKHRLDCPILYPADLVTAHQHWEQDHFQALWLGIIAERCTELHMDEGWEFSIGCTEEFVHVMQLRLGLPHHDRLAFHNTKENETSERTRMRSIRVFDRDGRDLALTDGLRLIEAAVGWMRREGFKSERLENSLRLLDLTGDLFAEGFYQ